VVLAILALAIPSLVTAANVTVNAIPGGGWIQGPDNTAGRSAVIATSPVAGLGTSSVKLTSTASSDFVGIGRQVLGPLSNLTGGAWMTLVPGTTGTPAGEAASLRFGMYRLGGTNEFTTMSVSAADNGTVTAGTWQTWTLSGSTMVWQTTADTPAFCPISAPCTFTAFKTQYPNAVLLGLQVAIGTGTPAVTSYTDGVSLTETSANETVTTDTWNFELAATAPTPPRATAPPTDFAAAATDQGSFDARPFIVLGLVSLIALLSISLRRTRPTH
jgi:hypothetical protein